MNGWMTGSDVAIFQTTAHHHNMDLDAIQGDGRYNGHFAKLSFDRFQTGNIVTIDSTTSVADACSILADNKM